MCHYILYIYNMQMYIFKKHEKKKNGEKNTKINRRNKPVTDDVFGVVRGLKLGQLIVGEVQLQQVPHGPRDADVQLLQLVLAEVDVGDDRQVGPDPHGVDRVNSAAG